MFATLFLGGALFLLVNEAVIIAYVCLQFVVLVFGYLASHLLVIARKDRKRFSRKLWLYVTGLLTAGSVSFIGCLIGDVMHS